MLFTKRIRSLETYEFCDVKKKLMSFETIKINKAIYTHIYIYIL